MNISLTDEMRAYVEKRIASGRYGSASEYFRELLRADQDQRQKQELEALLLEGLNSGEPVPLTSADFDSVRQHVRTLASKRTKK